MTLSAGSRLGPYEVVSPLGAGGMGEVYRARDPRLGREVAVKVLPASLSRDPDRLRRFEQEVWRELIPADSAGVDSVGPVLLVGDGRSYVYGYSRTLSDLFVVDGLR